MLPVAAVLLPILFVYFNPPFMPRLFTTQEHLFGMFSFWMWLALSINILHTLRRHPKPSLEKLTIFVLPFLVSFFFLYLIVEYFERSWDYEQYEAAFRTIVQGGNPYESTRYLYPPVFAQFMASLYLFAEEHLSFLGINLWLFVYYIHQCIQFFLAILAYQLSRRFASTVGFTEFTGTVLVSGLFVFNYPLFRTFHLNQVNLYVLNTVLVALLTARTQPLVSGMAVAFGGLIKIYPFVLGLPMFLTRKWKAVLGIVAGMGVIILIQTRFGQDMLLWKQFFHFYTSFPFERESSFWFRNSSLLSFIRSLVQLTGMPESLTLPMFIVTALCVMGWVMVRFDRRRRYFAKTGNANHPQQDIGHLIDFSVLTLLITPSAWDHHYVVAIPLALWAMALGWERNPGWLLFGLSSVFILPPFDVFPFSYVRTLGIVVLLALAAPEKYPSYKEVSAGTL